jgi:hypothetical protein
MEELSYPSLSVNRLHMTRLAITQVLENLNINFDEIQDQKISQALRFLFQLTEVMNEDIEKLRKENQKLRDEINLLKGEQGKPDVPASKKKDISSEKERKASERNKEKKSKAKNHKINIDRTQICEVNKRNLPKDAEFKGYQDCVVQGISIKTDNVLYQREIYYSRSQKKTYLGELPLGVKGGFSPEVKSFILMLKHAGNVSEPKIHEVLETFSIYISPSTVSRILIKKNDIFHQEKEDIFFAGLSSSTYQQIDDTGARVNGENWYVQILCNPYYTAYFTIPRKDRLSVLDILQGGKPRSYLFNEEAFGLMTTFRLSQKVISALKSTTFSKTLDDKQMQELLENLFAPGKGKNQRTRIMEASAIAAYHHQTDFPVVQNLLSDDAPQFRHITKEQSLCWVHDGRHYKKLGPVVPMNKETLGNFRGLFWDYYDKLLQYKENPTQQKIEELSAEFEQLFSTQTDYQSLDERIAKTKAKMQKLLMVLKYPELPLHNNASELGARVQARWRDVSLHTITEEGTKAKDTFMTIVQTAKKMGVNVHEYVHDRISKRFKLPSLADLIKAKQHTASACYNTGFT